MGAGNKAGSISSDLYNEIILKASDVYKHEDHRIRLASPCIAKKSLKYIHHFYLYVHFEHQEETDCKKHSLQPNYLGMRVLLFCSVAKIIIKRLQASLKPRSESLQKQMHLKSDLAKSRLINFIPTLLF